MLRKKIIDLEFPFCLGEENLTVVIFLEDYELVLSVSIKPRTEKRQGNWKQNSRQPTFPGESGYTKGLWKQSRLVHSPEEPCRPVLCSPEELALQISTSLALLGWAEVTSNLKMTLDHKLRSLFILIIKHPEVWLINLRRKEICLLLTKMAFGIISLFILLQWVYSTN